MKVNVNTLKIGDTVIHDGVMVTLTNSNMKRCPLMGTKIYGDSYRMGTILIEKVVFNRGVKNG